MRFTKPGRHAKVTADGNGEGVGNRVYSRGEQRIPKNEHPLGRQDVPAAEESGSSVG